MLRRMLVDWLRRLCTCRFETLGLSPAEARRRGAL